MSGTKELVSDINKMIEAVNIYIDTFNQQSESNRRKYPNGGLIPLVTLKKPDGSLFRILLANVGLDGKIPAEEKKNLADKTWNVLKQRDFIDDDILTEDELTDIGSYTSEQAAHDFTALAKELREKGFEEAKVQELKTIMDDTTEDKVMSAAELRALRDCLDEAGIPLIGPLEIKPPAQQTAPAQPVKLRV